MSEAVYVRFDEETLNFIESLSKQEKVTRSETIKKLIGYAVKKISVEKAISNYKEGKGSMRDCAENAGLKYFEFFDLLAKENLIGTSPDNTELLFKRLKQ